MLDSITGLNYKFRDSLGPAPRISEITLQLDTVTQVKMDRKLFKSPPIARLKSAPKKRTEKKIRVSSSKGGIAKYTRRLSIKVWYLQLYFSNTKRVKFCCPA